MFNRISKLFLLITLILFSFTSLNLQVQAEENDNFIVHDPEIETFSEVVYLEFRDNVSKRISKETFEDIQKNAQESYNELNANEITYNESETLQEPKSLQSITPLAAANYVSIVNDTTYDKTTNTINLKSTISNIIGTKPTIILTGYHLHSSKTLEGTYSKVAGFDVEWTGNNIYIGKSHAINHKVTSSNFWITKGKTTSGWTGELPKTSSTQSQPVLTNKKASIYPSVYNSHSKKYMPRPTKANLSVVPLESRVPWSNTLRGNYISGYIDTYGTPSWNWSDYDIHHVIPKEYGGSNQFSNLFPVLRTIHQQTINPWWAAY